MSVLQTDERHQPTDATNSTFPESSKYTRIDMLHYGLKTNINVKDLREYRDQISTKKVNW